MANSDNKENKKTGNNPFKSPFEKPNQKDNPLDKKEEKDTNLNKKFDPKSFSSQKFEPKKPSFGASKASSDSKFSSTPKSSPLDKKYGSSFSANKPGTTGTSGTGNFSKPGSTTGTGSGFNKKTFDPKSFGSKTTPLGNKPGIGSKPGNPGTTGPAGPSKPFSSSTPGSGSSGSSSSGSSIGKKSFEPKPFTPGSKPGTPGSAKPTGNFGSQASKGASPSFNKKEDENKPFGKATPSSASNQTNAAAGSKAFGAASGTTPKGSSSFDDKKSTENNPFNKPGSSSESGSDSSKKPFGKSTGSPSSPFDKKPSESKAAGAGAVAASQKSDSPFSKTSSSTPKSTSGSGSSGSGKPPVDTPKTEEVSQKGSSINKILLAAVIVLLICVGGLGWIVIDKNSANEELASDNTILVEEKAEVKNELNDLKSEFQSLTTDNEELQAKIADQEAKIAEYLVEIEKGKINKRIIGRLRRETRSLRKIMKGYVTTIDSLNQANQFLTENLETAKSQIGSMQENMSEIQNVNSELKDKVAKGSILQTSAFETGAIKVRGNGSQTDTRRSNKTDLIKACFDIEENRVADPGSKEVFLRVIKPDGAVLVKNEDPNETMVVDGVAVQYTMKREIDYQNQKMNVCFYYELDGMQIPEGKYLTEVYSDNTRIGKGYFELK